MYLNFHYKFSSILDLIDFKALTFNLSWKMITDGAYTRHRPPTVSVGEYFQSHVVSSECWRGV